MPGKQSFDLVVLGAGPGGYAAASRAAELGMKTACIEKEDAPGGVCLRVGCIPSKALLESTEHLYVARNRFNEHAIRADGVSMDLALLMERKNRIVAGLAENVRKLLRESKVTLIRGTAGLLAPDKVGVTDDGGARTELNAGAVLLATGSEPVRLPFLPFDGTKVISSTEALALDSVPRRLGIIGGGAIGLELGSVWARLGSKVTIIEMLPGIAYALDSQAARLLDRLLRKQGLELRLNTGVVGSDASGTEVRLTLDSGGSEEQLAFDKVLVAVGRKPLTRGLGIEELGIRLDGKGFVLVDENYCTNIPGV
ncbi:MAG: FAD-dependent oxidoreductase, partial [Syntrophobacteraceae bacterium]